MRTLYETLLDRDYKVDLSDFKLAYAISQLPKCPLALTDHSPYLFGWPNSKKTRAQFGKLIKEILGDAGGIVCKKITDVLDQSGVLLPRPNQPGDVAAWDVNTNTYIYSRIYEITSEELDEKQIQKFGFESKTYTAGGKSNSNQLYDMNWTLYKMFGILYDQVNDLHRHGNSLIDDLGLKSGIFYPCEVDMNEIKKALDAKASK